MESLVRSISPSDKQSWRDLYHAYLHFYETEPIPESTELVWQRLTSESPQIKSVVVAKADQLIGFAHFHIQLSTWSQTSHCYLEDLYVDPSQRGLGVGSKLIDAVKSQAKKFECTEMYWITRTDNRIARNLYDSVAKLSDFVRYEITL
jgi:ribosomal protein S18 acetylase RimI-like enzyme